MRYTLCGAALALTVIASAAASQTESLATPRTLDSCYVSGNSASRLRVGVRAHARPFSYRSETLNDVLTAATPGPLAAKKFTGYIIKICDAALNDVIINMPDSARMSKTDIAIMDLDCAQRVPDQQPGSRFRYLNGDEEHKIDILCDPATITNDRRAGMMISAPVYLTGISYITPKAKDRQRQSIGGGNCPRIQDPNTDKIFTLFGLVGNTTAGTEGIRALLEQDELPTDKDALIGFLKRDTTCENEPVAAKAKLQNIDFRGPVRFFKSHADAAKAFCNGEIHYYIGDREIITANVSNVPGCEYNNGGRTFTTDRYAVFGRLDYEDDHPRALLVALFFEVLSQKILSHPSILDQAFYDTFHPTKPTPALDFFFRAVRGAP